MLSLIIFCKHKYLPTTKRSSSGTPLNSFLKSSDLDLYDGYKTLYHDFFLARSDNFELFGRSGTSFDGFVPSLVAKLELSLDLLCESSVVSLYG